MAEGPKTTVRLTPIMRAYLDDLAKLGAYGKGRAGVMRRFIGEGVADALEKKVIAPRSVSDFGEDADEDRVDDDC